MNEIFRKLAAKIAQLTGTVWAFFLAVLIILTWAISGPLFNYSNTWQLTINSTTTILTFLMVFIIQNTQNRDSKAIHLKLDELIKAIKGARNKMLNVEDLADHEIEKLHAEYQQLYERYSQALLKRSKARRAARGAKKTTKSTKVKL